MNLVLGPSPSTTSLWRPAGSDRIDSRDADEEHAASGKVIRSEVLRPLGVSLTKAAEILGVRRATLSDLANGKTAVSAEMALRLEKAFGASIDLLLCMQAGLDAAQIRRHAAEIADVRTPAPDKS